ncbi:hypothetical protein NDU88_003199 [Pleurodeles waltl]|uniref:Uncharacterized protein n=1 Tax=Pleurodeles waltl TaxID=8319 RepID=A0AAV7UC34_PLEWA|nr:hypothetical protein NDU88_003199 [Pleurodeles waltl]
MAKCERKHPAKVADYDSKPTRKQKPQAKPRVTLSPELDDHLQVMLMAAMQLVAQKGKVWVDIQVSQPREQEQRQGRSRQPRQRPVHESDRPVHTPSRKRLAAITAASARNKGPQRVQSGGNIANRFREASRSESPKVHKAPLVADSSGEGSSSSEEDKQPSSPVASMTAAAETGGVQQTNGHSELIAQCKNGKQACAGKASGSMTNLGTQVGVVNTIQQGPQSGSEAQYRTPL